MKCSICGKEGGVLWNNGLTVCEECAKKLPAFTREPVDKSKLIRLCKVIARTTPPEDCIFACPSLKVGRDSVQLDARTPFCFPLSAIRNINWVYLPRRKLSSTRCSGELRALINFAAAGTEGYFEAYLTDGVTAQVHVNAQGKVTYTMDDRLLPVLKSSLAEYVKSQDFDFWKGELSAILMNESQQMTEESARLVLGIAPDAVIDERTVRKARNRMLGFVHPDRGGSDGLMFRVSKAADYLSGKE